MATSFSRLITAENAKHEDRRRKTRRKASRTAHLDSGAKSASKVQLVDVSEHGCAVEGGTENMRVGGFVTIALGAGEPVQAIVRWLRGNRAGLEYLWPIPPEKREWHELMHGEII